MTPHNQASRGRGTLIGITAGLVALAVAELVAGLSARLKSPVVDVGDRVISLVPAPVKEFAIEVFGTADKTALLVGIMLILLGYSAVVGVLTVRRSPVFGVAGIGLFGLIGAISGAAGTAGVVGILPSIIGAAAGIWTLLVMARWTPTEPSVAEHHFGASRRSFLVGSSAVLGAAVTLGGVGRLLDSRFDVGDSRSSVALPPPLAPLAPIPAATAFDIRGLTPFTTPNAEFYRIDTALTVPQVPIDTYTLQINGLVDRPMSLSYQDLLDRELIESDITMTCVSNEVGGKLVGNARWVGVRLDDLLEKAGVRSEADQIVGRSVDRYTCGFPVAALDGRDAMVALAMNGEPLPLEHGFPARLIVPGLYGYVSATKWLKEIQLTTFADFDHYWVGRGWSAEAPIKTQSRIDTPGPLERIQSGATAIAGVAWAQTRGIEKVEVRIDDGEWEEAELASELNDTTWRQWRFTWTAPPGRHDIACRATDSTGELQTEQRAQPMPDGATGWHSIVVLVDG